MTRYFLLVFAILSFSNCSNNEDKIPKGILSKEKMTAVLLDVHILESSMNMSLVKQNIKTNDTTTFYPVFKSNSITKKEYEESLAFYKSKPKLLNEIYDSVLVLISTMQAEKVEIKK